MAGNVPLLIKLAPSCNALSRTNSYKLYIIIFTFFCYTSYHLSRKPISIVKSVLHQKNCSVPLHPGGRTYSPNSTDCDWGPFDHSNFAVLLGSLDNAYLAAYAIGMFFSGHLAERMNLRYFMSGGMLLSGIFTAAFGLGFFFNIHYFWYYIIIQILGGFVQSTGWPSVVTCMGNWYGKGKRGLIMGIWNSHTSVGNILGSLIAGVWVDQAWGWSFVVPGIIIASIGVIAFLTLVPEPSIVGCDQPQQQLPQDGTINEVQTQAAEVDELPYNDTVINSGSGSVEKKKGTIGNGVHVITDHPVTVQENNNVLDVGSKGETNLSYTEPELTLSRSRNASTAVLLEMEEMANEKKEPIEKKKGTMGNGVHVITDHPVTVQENNNVLDVGSKGETNLSYTEPELTLSRSRNASTAVLLEMEEMANEKKEPIEVPITTVTPNGVIVVRKKNESTGLLVGQKGSPDKAISFLRALFIPGVLEFSLCLFCAKLVSYTFLFWLPKYISVETDYSAKTSGDLSTLFDVGGILGGICAGVISDYTGARASTCCLMLTLAAPMMFIYNQFGSVNLAHSIGLLLVCGFLVNGPYALITTAVSADLGTHKSLQGNTKALATVTAIIDGTGSIGAAIGPLLTGVISPHGWNNVFYMLIAADLIAMVFLARLVYKEIKGKIHSRRTVVEVNS